VKPLLLDPSAAALNQNDQNDDKQHAANNLDNRGSVHVIKIPFRLIAFVICSLLGKVACGQRRLLDCTAPPEDKGKPR
jgi:hypothetical protein